MTEEEKAIIFMENFVTELYLAKFGHLTSLSAFHNNKNFQAKRVEDGLIFHIHVVRS